MTMGGVGVIYMDNSTEIAPEKAEDDTLLTLLSSKLLLKTCCRMRISELVPTHGALYQTVIRS
jgi:hypothetical protein